MVIDDPPPPRDTDTAAIAAAILNNALSPNISLSLVLGRRLDPCLLHGQCLRVYDTPTVAKRQMSPFGVYRRHIV